MKNPKSKFPQREPQEKHVLRATIKHTQTDLVFYAKVKMTSKVDFFRFLAKCEKYNKKVSDDI